MFCLYVLHIAPGEGFSVCVKRTSCKAKNTSAFSRSLAFSRCVGTQDRFARTKNTISLLKGLLRSAQFNVKRNIQFHLLNTDPVKPDIG